MRCGEMPLKQHSFTVDKWSYNAYIRSKNSFLWECVCFCVVGFLLLKNFLLSLDLYTTFMLSYKQSELFDWRFI